MNYENNNTQYDADRNDKWFEDIDYLTSELPKRHANLFFSCKEETFFNDLKERNNNTINNSTNNIFVEEANLPLYRKNPDKYYWFQYLSEFKTVYFKYNACRDMEEKNLLTYGRELICFINENIVDKLIIDIRNNFGGNSQLLDDFIKALHHCEKVNRKGSKELKNL